VAGARELQGPHARRPVLRPVVTSISLSEQQLREAVQASWPEPVRVGRSIDEMLAIDGDPPEIRPPNQLDLSAPMRLACGPGDYGLPFTSPTRADGLGGFEFLPPVPVHSPGSERLRGPQRPFWEVDVEVYPPRMPCETNVCPRCGAPAYVTVARWSDQGEPEWFYDLHGAVRELLGQDGDVPFLAGKALAASARSFEDIAELDFVGLIRNPQKSISSLWWTVDSQSAKRSAYPTSAPARKPARLSGNCWASATS
jgi:hypothetical protein